MTTAPHSTLHVAFHAEEQPRLGQGDHRCPAGVCKALIHYDIDQAKCDGCHACVTACSTGAITGQVKYPHLLNQELWIKCGACIEACKREAVLRA